MGRLAVVPMVAGGARLDVTPGMIEVFAVRERTPAAQQAVAAMEVIYAEEVHHVALWLEMVPLLCGRHEVDPKEAFHELVRRYFSWRA